MALYTANAEKEKRKHGAARLPPPDAATYTGHMRIRDLNLKFKVLLLSLAGMFVVYRNDRPVLHKRHYGPSRSGHPREEQGCRIYGRGHARRHGRADRIGGHDRSGRPGQKSRPRDPPSGSPDNHRDRGRRQERAEGRLRVPRPQIPAAQPRKRAQGHPDRGPQEARIGRAQRIRQVRFPESCTTSVPSS